MTSRFYAIAGASQRLQNPLSEGKLLHLGQVCRLNSGSRVLDLACGRGELLCLWARHYGVRGVGVDEDAQLIEQAEARAAELEVWQDVHFSADDVAAYPQPFHSYDVVSCMGGTWAAGGAAAMLELMRVALGDPAAGLLLLGESFWNEVPPPEVCEALGISPEDLPDLGGLSDMFDAAGVELLQLVAAAPEEWDRYYAAQWEAVRGWLQEHPQDPDGPALRGWLDETRRAYLRYERRYLGWGVFVLKIRSDAL